MYSATTQEGFPFSAYRCHRRNVHQYGRELNRMQFDRNSLVNLRYRYLYLDKNPTASPKSWMFEMDLSHYIAEQIQYVQFQLEADTITASSTTPNPTLLSELGVKTALERFAATHLGQGNHEDVAHRFLTQTANNVFGIFKLNLYTYLIAVLPVVPSLDEFKLQLWNRIEHQMPDHNEQIMTPFLLAATCRNLFQFLTVESAQNLNHQVLSDLIKTLNPLLVAELMLRILLLCPPRRVHLEKRLRLLFHHYAHYHQSEVSWLVQLLEYLNLAYCTHPSATYPKRGGRKLATSNRFASS